MKNNSFTFTKYTFNLNTYVIESFSYVLQLRKSIKPQKSIELYNNLRGLGTEQEQGCRTGLPEPEFVNGIGSASLCNLAGGYVKKGSRIQTWESIPGLRCGIISLESIPGLLKSIKIPSLVGLVLSRTAIAFTLLCNFCKREYTLWYRGQYFRFHRSCQRR